MSLTELLQLTIGLKGYAGDSFSAENGQAVPPYQVIPLVMPEMATGFSLDNNNMWQPGLPTLKGGGSWAESVLSDGRFLQSEAVGNVTENIPLIASGGSWTDTAALIVALNRFIQNARRFTATRYQIQPVHVEWKASCSPASQWALVYNIDFAPDVAMDSTVPYISGILTIEREPYWRAFPRGTNPKMWAFYKRNIIPTRAQLNLLGSTDHFKSATIQNKHEWTPTGGNAYLTPISKNYIDIEGIDIPGDAPALVEIGFTPNSPAVFGDMYIGKSSKDTRAISNTGVERADAYILNAGDAFVTAGFTKTSATKTAVPNTEGVLSNGSSVTFYNVVIVMPISGGYETGDPPIVWRSLAGGQKLLDKQLMRGRYAVFIRAGQTTGAVSETFMRFQYTEPSTGSSFPPVNFYSQEVAVSFVGIVRPVALHYMGEIQVPFGTKAEMSAEGLGLEVLPPTLLNCTFGIDTRNASAAGARTVEVTDLILIPIDEGGALIQTPRTVSNQSTELAIYDNTGYLTRGDVLDIAITVESGSQAALNLYSNPITFIPGIDQRLYFIATDNTLSLLASLETQYAVTVNIIPRWSWIRDQ